MLTLDEAIKHLSIKSDTFSLQLLILLEKLRRLQTIQKEKQYDNRTSSIDDLPQS